MRKYSPILALVAIITALVILQIVAREVPAKAAYELKPAQMGLSTFTGMSSGVARITPFVNCADEYDHTVNDKKVGLKIVDRSKINLLAQANDSGGSTSVGSDDEDSGGEDEGKGSEAGGQGDSGSNRLWDSVRNG
jgi:hypothetical protein